MLSKDIFLSFEETEGDVEKGDNDICEEAISNFKIGAAFEGEVTGDGDSATPFISPISLESCFIGEAGSLDDAVDFKAESPRLGEGFDRSSSARAKNPDLTFRKDLTGDLLVQLPGLEDWTAFDLGVVGKQFAHTVDRVRVITGL